MGAVNTAKIILISSLVTIFVVFSMLFIGRNWLAGYLVPEIVPAAEQAIDPTLYNSADQIIQAIEKVNPAVVSIIVTKDVPVFERYYESFDSQSWFGGFSIPRVRESGTEEREVGGGSGFIVGPNGLIVTNRHVVDDNEARYSVLLNNGISYQVEVLDRDSDLDIAVLQIDEPLEEPLDFAQFGDSRALRLGEPVIAIGNALAEFRNSVSVGVVSGLSRSIIASDSMGRTEELHEVIQTDAAINPGNSGGPLLNSRGEVIGVNVATSRDADNIGFALPSHEVSRAVDSVRQYGEILRPFLGVRYIMINPGLASENNLPSEYGALVINGSNPGDLAVMPGSPAEVAGIRADTIILSIDGVELREKDLANILRDKTIGQTVILEVLQDGEEKTISLTLERKL